MCQESYTLQHISDHLFRIANSLERLVQLAEAEEDEDNDTL